jgi:large subunit ribosomal protein L13
VHPSKRDEPRYRHSGYPGGLTQRTVGQLLESRPTRVVELAVRGMLPKNSLGRKQLKKLKVYAGPDHPHSAQQPKPFKINQVAQGVTK